MECESGQATKEATVPPRLTVTRADTGQGHNRGMETKGHCREGAGWYRSAISHGRRLLKQKVLPTTAECVSATGILRKAQEPPTLSFFEENSQGSLKLFSNSVGARHKACFSSLFSLPVKIITPGTWDLPEQCLCISILSLSSEGSVPAFMGASMSPSTPFCCVEPRQRGREGQVLFHLFLASTALHCS